MDVHFFGEIREAIGLDFPNISCHFKIVRHQPPLACTNITPPLKHGYHAKKLDLCGHQQVSNADHWKLHSGLKEGYTQCTSNEGTQRVSGGVCVRTGWLAAERSLTLALMQRRFGTTPSTCTTSRTAWRAGQRRYWKCGVRMFMAGTPSSAMESVRSPIHQVLPPPSLLLTTCGRTHVLVVVQESTSALSA